MGTMAASSGRGSYGGCVATVVMVVMVERGMQEVLGLKGCGGLSINQGTLGLEFSCFLSPYDFSHSSYGNCWGICSRAPIHDGRLWLVITPLIIVVGSYYKARI